jgi:hypothetical protein
LIDVKGRSADAAGERYLLGGAYEIEMDERVFS